MPDTDKTKLKESVAHLRAAVAKIQELGVLATPENYSVWYDYYSGRKPSLKKVVDQRLNSGGQFTAEFSRRVYAQFFLSDPERELSNVRTAIRNLIDTLTKELGEIDQSMGSYTQVLDDCSDDLKQTPEMDALSTIVEKLLEETQKCRTQSAKSASTVNQLNQEISQMRETLQEMSEVAFEDAVTGIPNRRALNRSLEALVGISREEEAPLCLLLLDIDFFKKVNDEHGHLVGDRVLRFIAEMIKRSVKGADFVARFGGEEFAVLLPNTDIKGGYIVAESILKNVSSTRVKINKDGERLGRITLSGGITQLKSDDDIESLTARADRLLYSAKNSGRNSVKGDLD